MGGGKALMGGGQMSHVFPWPFPVWILFLHILHISLCVLDLIQRFLVQHLLRPFSVSVMF